jgi:predicted CoA-substrate-specific enzyme activase
LYLGEGFYGKSEKCTNIKTLYLKYNFSIRYCRVVEFLLNEYVVAGIDAGSTAIKIILFDGHRMEARLHPVGWNPRAECLQHLAEAAHVWDKKVDDFAEIVVTGYGRRSLPFAARAMTEITCHAKGAFYLCPQAKTVIDIGGQDAKAIRLEDEGKVAEFIMNDKCAAGTGRFLQVIANALGMDLSDASAIQLSTEEEVCTINSMCAVFAESEVIGLLHQGCSPRSIIMGIYRSIAARTAAMAARVSLAGPVVFTGGVAANRSMQIALESATGLSVLVPEKAVYAGAIGAALFAWEEINK